MNMRKRWGLLPVVIAMTGCVKTQRFAVARSGPMAARVTQDAPVDAIYTVQVRQPNAKDFDSIDIASVHVRPGTPLGFDRADDGVHAFAGDVRFKLVDANDADLKWTAKKRAPTKFARALEATGEIIAIGALGTAGLVLEGAVGGALDRATRDVDAPRGHHRRQ